MTLKQKRILKQIFLTLECLGIILLLAFFGSTNPPFRQTDDDSFILFQFLEKQNVQQVLGASSNSQENPCPEDKPIIGWIDFSGNKQVRKVLPPGSSASACFKDLEEAQSQGFKPLE